jgi:hypothetical protein
MKFDPISELGSSNFTLKADNLLYLGTIDFQMKLNATIDFMPDYKLPYQGYFQGRLEVTHDAIEVFHPPQFNLT